MLLPGLLLPAVAASLVCAVFTAAASAQATVPGVTPAAVPQAGAPPSAPFPNAPSATIRPLRLPGGMIVQQETPGALPLTLDQAIATSLKNNAEIILRGQQEQFVRGQILTVANALLPNLKATAYSRAQELNLAAMGFRPGTFSIPGFNGSIPEIVKVNTTSAQVSLSQQLTIPAYFLYRAAQKTSEAANWATLSARGGVVLNTGSLYLRILADQAQVRNAAALIQQDQVVFDHARQSRDAGVGISLDVLRAQVQLQNEQQQYVRALNAEAKDKVQLNRLMGQPAGQELELVDHAPCQELQELSLQDALKIAYEKRKDYRGLEAQLEVAQKVKQAVRYERLPSFSTDDFYGVLGETTGLYHGVFSATAKLSIPIFAEAELRGQREVAESQIIGVRNQLAGLRSGIEADIRSSMLDVQSSAEQVKVARSNVELAGQALADATDRFTSGVDDNLPVIRAQAALVGAQTQVIQAEFQYNVAKLQLARNTGVVETEYNQYLGR